MLKKIFLMTLVAVLFIPVLAYGADIPATGRRDAPDDWYIFVRNTSGGDLSHGMSVIWDTAETTQQGWAVTTTTSADAETVAGVVPDSSSEHALTAVVADDDYLWIQIRGINDDVIIVTADTVTAGQSIGTSTTAGEAGDGDGLGVALETVPSGSLRATAFINIDN